MRKLASLAFAFAGGIALAQYLLPVSCLLPLGILCAVVGLVAGFALRTRRRIPWVAVGLTLAFLWAGGYHALVLTPAEALAGTTSENAVMTLLDYPTATAYGARAEVRLETIPGIRRSKILYYGDADLLTLSPGDTVTDTVRLKSALHLREEDTTLYASQGIFLLAYSGDIPIYHPAETVHPRFWPVRMGHRLKESIASLFEGDAAGLLTAILTGDKSLLSDGARTDLTEAGIYHLTAVSGMHCAVLLTGLIFLIGRHHRRLIAAVAIPILLFYMLLTGASPSVVRACVMLTSLLIAPLFRRVGDPPTSMSLALMLILLQNPYAVTSLSLQLSFGAVAGLLWVSPCIRLNLPGRQYRAGRFLTDSLSASLGAVVFTLPISAAAFGSIQLIAPLSNLLCLWAASLIFGTGLAVSLLGMFVPPLASLLCIVPNLLISYVLRVSHLMSLLPGHSLSFTNPYLKYWLVFAYLLFGAAILRKASARTYGLAAVLAVLTLLVSVQLGQLRFAGHRLDAVVLDIGQGQCILLKSGDQTAMVDCGSANSWIHPGDLAAVQLRDMGCRHLDLLLLTHYDNDHVCGVLPFLRRTHVDRLLLPDSSSEDDTRGAIVSAAEAAGTTVEYISAERVEPLGEAVLTVYPPLGTADESNELGLSVLTSVDDYDLLITGDMNTETEEHLLETFVLPDIETLIAGHHGSKYSTSADLLAALHPETAVISSGVNSYGHPARETLRRLSLAGVDVYRTDLQGSIHLYR